MKKMIEKIFRWGLFCAGIIMAIFAGYMFYIDKIAAGAAWLSVSVGFLCFATRVRNSSNYYDDDDGENNFRPDRELHDIAVLVADLAVMSLKTSKPGKKEIEYWENRVNNLLKAIRVSKSERDEIIDKFDALKGKTQLEEKGRAFFNQLGIGN